MNGNLWCLQCGEWLAVEFIVLTLLREKPEEVSLSFIVCATYYVVVVVVVDYAGNV